MSQQNNDLRGKFQWSFLAPRYWLIWFTLAIFLFLACLPWFLQWRIAQCLGNLSWKWLKSRKKTTLRNLELCFPEWSDQQREQQGQQVFIDMMTGVFETLNAWYFPHWFKKRVSIEGLEHIEKAQANQQGILLLGTHSTLLDAGGYICAQFFDPDVVYRPQNNPFLDFLIYRNRKKIYKHQISHHDMRGLITQLKNKRIIWYSPDQDFGLKQGIMAPFFGIPAATVTAHRRLLKMTNSVAIPLYFYRTGNISNPHYKIIIEPILENFPSTDEQADATLTNSIIEQQLRIAPTQYMWFHRRFKTRPQGEQSLY